ncbi:hypothetical protein V5F72_24510 [Xanthobacter flavus]|uniref:hypothetical protein n=1 Tax=Xanthobacter flavus TaxID=281 RepID=UPI003727C556
MQYIVPIAVVGILLLQASGAIPMDSVGGPMMIALAVLLGALAVGVHEAWTKQRGILGWIVSIVVSLVGALLIAPAGGMVVSLLLGPLMDGSTSVAAAGGAVMQIALAATMVVTLLGSWCALWLVNRLR